MFTVCRECTLADAFTKYGLINGHVNLQSVIMLPVQYYTFTMSLLSKKKLMAAPLVLVLNIVSLVR